MDGAGVPNWSLTDVPNWSLGPRRYPALFVSPAYQAALVAMGAFSGAAFYGDLEAGGAARTAVFGFSIVAIMGGMCCCGTGEAAAAAAAAGAAGSARAKQEPAAAAAAT